MRHLPRAAASSALLPALLTLVACDATSTTAPVTEDDIQTVTVAATKLDILGSCDHDNFLEGSDHGEFVFDLDVLRSGLAKLDVWDADDAFQERTHGIVGSDVTFDRNVTRGETFSIRFVGTEYDGLLGADPSFNALTGTQERSYVDGSWGTEETMMWMPGDKDSCFVRISYRVRSASAR